MLTCPLFSQVSVKPSFHNPSAFLIPEFSTTFHISDDPHSDWEDVHHVHVNFAFSKNTSCPVRKYSVPEAMKNNSFVIAFLYVCAVDHQTWKTSW